MLTDHALLTVDPSDQWDDTMKKLNQCNLRESRRRKAQVWLWTVGMSLVCTFSACSGQIGPSRGISSGSSMGGSSGGGQSSGGAGGLSTSPGTDAPACVEGASFAPARLSLISDDQYRNIVQDAFGVTIPSTFTVSTTPSPSGTYPYNESAQVQATTVQAYLRAADEVASLLTSIPTCSAGTVDATCMQAFLANQLPRAWRRPVTSDEMTGLMTIFNLAAKGGQAHQIQLTVEAALVHPSFLYRSEIGTDAASLSSGKVTLTPYEIASALSFAMLNSSPDTELWSKAQDGTIAQPEVLAAEVTRLMTLPQAQANLMKKVSYYLDFELLPLTSKDAATYPEFASLQPMLYQSSQMFLNDLMWSGQGRFDDLFTSRKIYSNAAMSMAYGLPPVSGTQLSPVTTTGDMYNAGLLTHPAFLAASNKNAVGDDVIHRGLWVYYNLTCAPALPLPPAQALAIAMTLTGDPTRYQAQYRDGPPIPTANGGVVAGSGCAEGCHGRFDPFGLVTMSYDGIGRYRTTDPSTMPPNGPVDDSANIPVGVLTGVPSNTTVNGVPFVHVNNVNDVAQLFLSGRQASDCAADTLATYTIDHSPDVERSCELQNVKDTFKKSGAFTDLFTAVLTSPAFLTRDIETQ
jgi:hypothetical protein